ncbi:MAG: hypothetical protein ACXIVQ_06935 [Acidimicrobiales bacterium]
MTRRWVPARPDADRHPGRGDGEPIAPGAVAQPVSVASSVAYVAAGWWIWQRRAASPAPGLTGAFAVVVAANGLGSMAFHGPGDRLSRAVHDGALCAALAFPATLGPDPVTPTSAEVRTWRTATAAALGAASAVAAPRSVNAVSGLFGGTAVTRHVISRRRSATPLGGLAACLVLGSAANAVGRHAVDPGTARASVGARLGHSAWHVATALAAVVWADAVLGTGSGPGARRG